MIIEKTTDGNLPREDSLAKGIVIFPENDQELKLINYLLEEETLDEFKNELEIKTKQQIWTQKNIKK
jgi:hypothetical protein